MCISMSECDNGTKRQVFEQLKTIRDDLPSEVASQLDDIMQKVKDLAIANCPKDTGALASSISLEGGAISASGQDGDFYNCSIYAGSDDIVNPITGKPTSEYAMLVHDGHAMRDGTIWEGEPFLENAILAYEGELEEAVNRAMDEINLDDVPSGQEGVESEEGVT